MSEWKQVKLGELLELKYGKDHKSLKNGSIPVFGSGGIMRYVDTSIYEQPSILIPRKGSLNNIFYVDFPFWTVDTIFWSKIKQEFACGKFLYYFLKEIDLESLNVGSAVPSLTVPVINDIEINLPSLPEQKAIADVLSALDDKIDLLHRQNYTLEQMAETLFRQWFVEEAQEDWEEKNLDFLFDISSGKSLNRKDFDDFGNFDVLGANGKIGKSNRYNFNEKLIFTGRVGTLGKVFIVDNYPVWLSDNTLVIKNIKYFYFTYFLLKNNELETYNVGILQTTALQTL